MLDQAIRCPFASLILLLAPAGSAAFDLPSSPAWKPAFVGVDRVALTLTEPRPLRVHAVRVDLTAEGVRLVTDRDNGPRPEETDGVKTSTFLVRNGCQIAINGAPFWPGQKEEDQPQNVVGLVVSDGVLVSPVDEAKPRAALVVNTNGRAAIQRPPIDLAGVATAVGGFGVVLRCGSVVRPQNEADDLIDHRHPRTAVGVADRGATLYRAVIDGRQPGYSEGVDLAELGKLLRWLGAEDALNLDGGGTSTLAMSKPDGSFELLNQPIDGGTPGRERISASHLGVYATPAPQTP